MPIRSYTCQKCAHDFDRLEMGVQPSDSPACPECLSSLVERQLSLPAKPVAAIRTAFEACPPDGSPCGRMGCSRLNQ
ncbi:MAG: FmdB family zinc ribbon protein [Gemmataceae bacterium]